MADGENRWRINFPKKTGARWTDGTWVIAIDRHGGSTCSISGDHGKLMDVVIDEDGIEVHDVKNRAFAELSWELLAQAAMASGIDVRVITDAFRDAARNGVEG